MYGKLTESRCFPIKLYERGLSVCLTKVCCIPSSVTYSHCNEILIKPHTTQSIYRLSCYKLRLASPVKTQFSPLLSGLFCITYFMNLCQHDVDHGSEKLKQSPLPQSYSNLLKLLLTKLILHILKCA